MITLLKLLNESYIFENKRLDQGIIEKSTFKGHKTRLNNIQEYLLNSGQTKIPAKSIDLKFISEFRKWLETDKKYQTAHVARHIHWIKETLNYSELCGNIPRNKIAAYKCKRVQVFQNNHLELNELYRLQSACFRPALLRTANLFVFACYTGLAYSDLMRFDTSQHIRDIDGKDWICMKRKKTDQVFHVPFFPEAKEMYLKFTSGIPKISNQKYNEQLKEIAKLCLIPVVLSTHSARKTFAIVCSERYSFSLEAISFMLGHKNLKTTQTHYARVRLNLVKSEFLRNVA